MGMDVVDVVVDGLVDAFCRPLTLDVGSLTVVADSNDQRLIAVHLLECCSVGAVGSMFVPGLCCFVCLCNGCFDCCSGVGCRFLVGGSAVVVCLVQGWGCVCVAV